MKNLAIMTAFSIVLAAPITAGAENFRAKLIGYEEVPAVSTRASGEFRAKYDKRGRYVDYELTIRDVQGRVSQAHIHFAQAGVNGSIVVWLCQTSTHPAPAAVAGLTPVCPDTSGIVTATISAANVVGGGLNQGLVEGEFDELIAAMEAGVAYVNVHGDLFPAGEIRGQIRR